MSEPSQPAPARGGLHTGRLVAGLLIALFGVGWFLQTLDVSELPWDVLLPGALILVGLALAVASRSGASQGGLIAVGMALTVVLAVGSVVDVPLEGGIGDRTVKPANAAALEDEYRLGVGSLTLDLTDLPSEGSASPPTIRARVGIGELVVVVPEGALPVVHAKAGVGETRIFGTGRSGLNAVNEFEPRTGDVPYVLELSVGIGSVKVRRE